MPKGLIRLQQSGQFHFITCSNNRVNSTSSTCSCYQRKPLLTAPGAYLIVEQQLEKVRQRYDLVVAGYILVPEHIHLLTSEPENATLALELQILRQETSKLFTKTKGSQFWQRRYFDFNVYTQAKAIEKLGYMHRNPVDRGLVSKPEDWRWSSARYYATGQPGPVKIDFLQEHRQLDPD